MHQRVGFNTERYIEVQADALEKLIHDKSDCLVIEFGGKVIQDKHAARVMPGYHEDAKLELIKNLLPKGELVFAVSGKDILSGRMRGDFKTRYDDEALRSLDELEKRGLSVRHVALTRLMPKWEDEPRLQEFIKTLGSRGISVHYFYEIEGYVDVTEVASYLDENSYIESAKPILIVISPGGGSGKFNVCLSQLYHLMKRGRKPFYVKLETFPVFNLSVDHPLHFAFMSASADFFDQVSVDGKHPTGATSYNRDMENYEILHRLAESFPSEGVMLKDISSATSMGVNRLKEGIVDEEIIAQESYAEVARRLARYIHEEKRGETSKETVDRARQILKMIWES